MKELKHGDRVKACGYDHMGRMWEGTYKSCGKIREILGSKYLVDFPAGTTGWFHRIQLRKLTIKPRQERWINTYEGHAGYVYMTEQGAKESVGSQGETIHFREVRKK